MNRLTSGTASLLALLLVGGCHGDPTEPLRGGVNRVLAAPSTLNVTLGKTKTTQVTAVDDQGNPLEFAYEIKSVGPGISVKRDSTFLPVFVSDSQLTVPPTAPTFQYIVSATDLVTSNFTITAGGKDVTVPVFVAPDPANVPVSTVAATGPNATDTTLITAPAGFHFSPGATVVFDAGEAVTLGVSTDGTTLSILPPPGATSRGVITGLFVPYFPSAIVGDSTDVALTINTTVPARPGTDQLATAPEMVAPPSGGKTGIIDGGSFGAAVCGNLSGFPCQLYKLTVGADAVLDATLTWDNPADLGLYILDSTGADFGQFCDALGRDSGSQEACALTLPAGTYYASVINFGPAYPENDPNPTWIKIQFQTE